MSSEGRLKHSLNTGNEVRWPIVMWLRVTDRNSKGDAFEHNESYFKYATFDLPGRAL